jgi:cyclopropane-fatty-acyl-phospholipid synthase
MLAEVITEGSLTVYDKDGTSHRYGDGTGVAIVARLHDQLIEWHLAADPEFAAGEGYRTGRLTLESGNVYDLVELATRNLKKRPFPRFSQRLTSARHLLRGLNQWNPMSRARRNVAHHYDIDPRIYDLFLDQDRQYSCAYFTAGAGLEEAQLAKKRHIAAKLALDRGQRVLDIGSGWGGLAIYLAAMTGVEVTGVTLSEQQLASSRERARAANLAGRARFDLADYRNVTGSFDRVVSVGMFEHVGVPQFGAFFACLSRLLKDDGVALLHTIGRSDRPCASNPFISRYIFPGGYIPAMSEILAAIERSGLICADVEVLRLHYAETLRAWRERFVRNRARAIEIAGEQFYRTWEFYLAGSEAAFRHQNLVVFQIQLTKRVETLPMLRDYMVAAERRLAAIDGRLGPRTGIAVRRPLMRQ